MSNTSNNRAPFLHKFSGLGTALITPFLPDGSIDVPALTSLTERQISSGTDYIVVLGSTAETPTLSANERELVKRTVVSVCHGRVPLVLGMGGNCTGSLTDEIKHADTRGFDAILSVCPYYNKPSQRGLVAHFSAVANASPLPVIVYNVPGRTGINMLPETVVEAAIANSNIIGIKEASGNAEQIRRLKTLVDNQDELRSRGFAIISGDDGLTPELAHDGTVCGVISVLSNALPKQWAEVIHKCLNDKAYQYDGRYDSITGLLFREGNPAGIKALLHVMGLCHNTLRLPLTAVSEQLLKDILDEKEKLAPVC